MAFLGFGTALPEALLTQEEAKGIAEVLCCRAPEDVTWLPVMYGQTGIDTRHISLGRAVVRDILDGTRHSGSIFLPKDCPDDAGPTTGQRMQLYAEFAIPLAVRAASAALTDSQIRPDEITHVVTVSCTGFFAPGVDCALIEQLPLKPTVQRTHVGFMGCHGAINGMRVCHAFAGSDPKARILLCAIELSCLHYHFGWDPQKIVANALFGDAAAAFVGRPANPAEKAWQIKATGSCVLPNSSAAMTWTIGDHGFEMTLSKQVPALIAKHLRPWITTWLAENGLSIDRVGSWAIHPGGPRILTAVEESLSLGPESTATSRSVFGRCGNVSSPTVLFIVDQMRRQNAQRPVVALAFGPGLVAEAALIV
jgi:predicted naringenin-chalcone synthase